MAGEKICDSCGKSYTGAECPECGPSWIELPSSFAFVSFVIITLLLITFTGTRFAVKSYDKKQAAVAKSWQHKGEVSLAKGRAEDAVEDFENSLVYDRENSYYRLQLASALEKAGRYDEARAHLLSLWEQRPGDANVNLQLARLEARQGDLAQTERFYEGAIFGVWPAPADPYESRAEARIELAQVLINHNRFEQAQAQLTALTSELSAYSDKRSKVADLLMKAGAPGLAYQQYLKARVTPKGPRSGYELQLAQAAYAQNDFPLAQHWVYEGERSKNPPAALEALGKKVSMVLAMDPYRQGISELERAKRVIKAFETADERMATCFPTYILGPATRSASQQQAGLTGSTAPPGKLSPEAMSQVPNLAPWAQQLRPRMTVKKLRHEDDVQENAMRFVFQAEILASRSCSLQPTDEDNALVTLARQRWSNE